MQEIKGSTTSEAKLFKAIQEAIGAKANGIIGTQTMSDIAIKVGAKGFPVTLSIYGMPTIIGSDLKAWSPKASLKGFSNSMLGSFTYPRATTPCSILINAGTVVCGSACHAFLGKPETVIYRLNDGTFGIKKCKYSSELPENVKWAVGGMGLLDMYKPAEEGFSGSYADVLRKTNHNVLAVKNGMVYGVYYKNMTGEAVQAHCRDKMKFDMAILLDGGGLAAINGEESFAKINTGCKQGYAIQFV